MLIVYNDNGMISQMHPFCNDEQLVQRYKQHGMNAFIAEEIATAITTHYVKIVNGKPKLEPRPIFPITVDKLEIRADGEDVAVISGVPSGAQVAINDGDETHIMTANGEPLEITAVDPSIYRVSVEKFPYLLWSVQILAV